MKDDDATQRRENNVFEDGTSPSDYEEYFDEDTSVAKENYVAKVA